jgi:hypothetical protein
MTRILALLAAVATALIVIVFSLGQQTVHAGGSNFIGDAQNCVSVQGNKISNTCNFAIAVVWCVDSNQGDTCDKGFTTDWNHLPQGQSTPARAAANPGLSLGTVQGIACKIVPNQGGFDLNHGDFNMGKKSARCQSDQRIYGFANGQGYIQVPVVPYKP